MASAGKHSVRLLHGDPALPLDLGALRPAQLAPARSILDDGVATLP